MNLIKISAHAFYIQITEGDLSGKSVVIYGAGVEGRRILNILNKYRISVAFFIDRNPQLAGQYIDGVCVVTPETFVAFHLDFILVLAIQSLDYCQKELHDFLVSHIFVPLKINTLNATAYEINTNVVIVFESPHAYNISPLWFWPLCYDRVDDFSQEYLIELHSSHYRLQVRNGVLMAADITSKYVNYKNGVRYTAFIPRIPVDNYIYFLGDSRAAGSGVEDCHTIASFLQKQVGNKYEVVNYGCNMFAISVFFDQLKLLPLKRKDIVVFSSVPYFTDFRVENKSYTTLSKQQSLHLFAFYLKSMKEYCIEKGALFIYLDVPYLYRFSNRSNVEEFMNSVTFQAQTMEILSPQEDAFFDPNYLLNSRISITFDISELYKVLGTLGIPYIDLSQTLSRPHSYGETYINHGHLSPNGNKATADAIFSLINAWSQIASDSILREICNHHYQNYLQVLSSCFNEKLMQPYLQYLRQNKANNVNESGCIVMNCNPFTNGHRYIIECASKQVSWLYVFVLEEDKSQFSFSDRIWLVEQGTSDLNNITVLRSAKFLISSLTMPEYFIKDKLQTDTINCFDDLFIFAHKIAPVLHISKRFAGTEPFCAITRQYNQQMKSMLSNFGISFIEIERLQEGTCAVSASEVRRCLEVNDFNRIKEIVPLTTYDYLKNLPKHTLIPN